jgi:hypothetical protein
MTKIPKVSPSTLAELKTNILTLRTKLEQIEYLSVVLLDFQDEDGRWVTYGEEYEKNKANCEELIQEMTVFAKNKIKNLGGRPIKWIEYPIVSSIGQYNEVKESFKDDGKLLEWVKWLLSNIEHHVLKSSSFLERTFNDRVLRQLTLDSKDKGEEYQKFVKRWGDAQNLEGDFEDYLERQLKVLSLVAPSNTPRNNFIDNSGKKSIGKTSPITFFIDEQIKEGEEVWKEAWSKLYKQAQKKLTDNEELTIWHIGEFSVFLRKAFKQTSKGLDHAVEYQEGESDEWKKVVRQSFGSMFRRAMKISRTQSDSPK